MKQYYVYLMTNRSRTLYTGMTSNLERRVYEHKQKLTGGFTAKYKINRLIYYEIHEDVTAAIAREKQIKSWRRSKKLALIEEMNPDWRDLSEDWQCHSERSEESPPSTTGPAQPSGDSSLVPRSE